METTNDQLPPKDSHNSKSARTPELVRLWNEQAGIARTLVEKMLTEDSPDRVLRIHEGLQAMAESMSQPYDPIKSDIDIKKMREILGNIFQSQVRSEIPPDGYSTVTNDKGEQIISSSPRKFDQISPRFVVWFIERFNLTGESDESLSLRKFAKGSDNSLPAVRKSFIGALSKLSQNRAIRKLLFQNPTFGIQKQWGESLDTMSSEHISHSA